LTSWFWTENLRGHFLDGMFGFVEVEEADDD
jgi:hypothetical protein